MTEAVHETAPGAVREPVLSVRDLSVSFRSDTRTVHAVDGVSYDLFPGEVLAVVGESGCGKSVTSMAVMGLLPPTARIGGSIRLGGRELAGASEEGAPEGPRQGHRDDLPGADDLAQPGPHHR